MSIGDLVRLKKNLKGKVFLVIAMQTASLEGLHVQQICLLNDPVKTAVGYRFWRNANMWEVVQEA